MIFEAITCLALNIYFEARNQPTKGQIAVSQVVMNRVESPDYPDDVCEVIYQGPSRPSWKGTGEMIPVRHKCQFSWYCDGKSDNPKDLEAYEKARMISWGVYSGTIDDLVDGALWYHADYVTPGWAQSKRPTANYGNHIFYTWMME